MSSDEISSIQATAALLALWLKPHQGTRALPTERQPHQGRTSCQAAGLPAAQNGRLASCVAAASRWSAGMSARNSRSLA